MKYFLDRDNDGHWFVVQAQYRKQWDEWLEIDPDDELSWTAPDFAERIDGPHRIEFEDWVIGG